uniref:Uncharacterized protein n=1 Tax=Cacopsylla melanoneura TaxID=428564 RepID=A0A8D8WKZ5_9HEMI
MEVVVEEVADQVTGIVPVGLQTLRHGMPASSAPNPSQKERVRLMVAERVTPHSTRPSPRSTFRRTWTTARRPCSRPGFSRASTSTSGRMCRSRYPVTIPLAPSNRSNLPDYATSSSRI